MDPVHKSYTLYAFYSALYCSLFIWAVLRLTRSAVTLRVNGRDWWIEQKIGAELSVYLCVTPKCTVIQCRMPQNKQFHQEASMTILPLQYHTVHLCRLQICILQYSSILCRTQIGKVACLEGRRHCLQHQSCLLSYWAESFYLNAIMKDSPKQLHDCFWDANSATFCGRICQSGRIDTVLYSLCVQYALYTLYSVLDEFTEYVFCIVNSIQFTIYVIILRKCWIIMCIVYI